MFSILTYLCTIFIQILCFKVEVNVREGILEGITENTIFDEKMYTAFYGVPYAASPIGKYRFKNPLPMAVWKAPRDVSKDYFGTCAQHHVTQRHALFGHEDCLRMNIYTPITSLRPGDALKPVIVWFHGFTFTSSFSHIYLPDHFLDNDVLFVSLSYRIGAFGFMKFNESDQHANMGLKDLHMGLIWIKKNIHKFGGDKEKVTIMASGSGASFASMLLLTKARKLFNKLILLSGGILSPSIFQGDAKVERLKIFKELKKLTTKKLNKASTAHIVRATDKIYDNNDFVGYQRPVVPFSPIIENKSAKSILTRRPSKSFLKKANITILIGFNSQEGLTDTIPFLSNPKNLRLMERDFKYFVPFSKGCRHDAKSEIYKKVAKIIKDSYLNNDFSEKTVPRFVKYASDIVKYPIYKFIKVLVEIQKKVFAFKFNYLGGFNSVKATAMSHSNLNISGTATGDELCYLFRCNPIYSSYHPLKTNTTHPDRIFIKKIVAAFANFAKTGDPTPDSYPNSFKWLPMTEDNNQLLLIKKKEIKMIKPNEEERMLKFWDNIFKKYYAPEHCYVPKHDEL